MSHGVHGEDGRDRQRLEAIARRAMFERGFEPDFSPAALAEVERLSEAGDDGGAPKATDLRHLPWSSIDNDDSRDLDQLEAAERKGEGEIRVWVAVADVDSRVRKGSAVDAHAYANTTSIYTAARI